jgi:hypothetical protein
MKANKAWDGLIVLVLSGLIDAGFVFIWIITQFLVSRFVFRTSLVETGLPGWIVLMFQLIFAISTLVPVALYVVRDVTISIRRLAEFQKGI